MKIILKCTTFLILITALVSCSSETPCVPVKCLNNGKSTPECGCDCPENYYGTDCSLEKVPAKITISKIRILNFPNTGGGSDDLGTKPDLFINIIKNNANIFTADTYFNDANGDGTYYYDYTFPTPLESISTSSVYTLQFWDYDTVGNSDLMGSIVFSPFLNYAKFPTSFIIQDESKSFKAEVFVTYKW